MRGHTLVDKHEDYFDIFAFSSKFAEKFSRFCFNNLDCLVKFKSYFRDSAKTMINELADNRMQMSVNYLGNSVCANDSITARNRKKLLESIEPKDYYFTHNNSQYQMTKREFECLKCLAQGRTMKEAGRILNISDRTVEEHIISLKNRFTVNNKTELIDLYLASDLIIL
ncbi:MAG: hypothetical protein GY821_13495 [Gammaproteobacteria bacterium]|nr:hypothetical protein [Gammaproteobacteria bacterium]